MVFDAVIPLTSEIISICSREHAQFFNECTNVVKERPLSFHSMVF